MDILETAKNTILEALPNIDAIYLFGSYASSTSNSKSDLDLAILPKKKLDKVKLWNLAQEIAIKIDKDVDLIDLFEASTVFKFQIVHEGRIIYSTSDKVCNFFDNYVHSSYLKFNEERKEILDKIKKTGKIYE
ncbi:nucleotidyltransferase domain-containing protein [Sulfobacillus acidophilus]|uniref:Nucleotidyltransferase domain-containing protein n=1 Tax=Sulfobacillus acidophilus TaxID=53633 RepID=A0ABS3AZ16_9FIRM|nr:nucleotidyltransferase domain-containing protein [Sulfobacillus acidophilus]